MHLTFSWGHTKKSKMSKNGDKKVVEISKSLIEDSNDRDNVSRNSNVVLFLYNNIFGRIMLYLF